MIDRARLTERMSLALARIELKRALKPLAILAIGFVAAAGAGDYILTNINGGIGSTHTMQFQLADVTGVVPGRAEVRFYGITAGQITNVQLENGHAILTASVATKFGTIYKDANVQLRPNTALQDMYLDIVNRGTPSAGVAGPNYVIPQNQAQSPVNLSAVLNTFQPDVRTQLYNLLDNFGNGLADRGYALRRAFAVAAPFIQIAGNVANQLAARATLTKQFVHNASTLASLLASRSTQLHQFVTEGTRTLQALSTQGGAPLRNTISEVSGSLGTVDGTWQALRSALPNVQNAVNRLGPVANDLSTGLTSLKQLSDSARPALAKLQRPVTQLTPLASQLQPVTGDLATSVTRIQPQVSDFNTLAFDSAKCIAFINQFFNWDYSMSKFYDQYGPMVRGNVHVGLYTLPATKQTNYVEDYQCAGGHTIRGIPTPKYNGPAPAP
jgi:ABC-type transporter Mla subunit MlaD